MFSAAEERVRLEEGRFTTGEVFLNPRLLGPGNRIPKEAGTETLLQKMLGHLE